MIKRLHFIYLILLSISVVGQDKIEFSVKEHDFLKIEEEGGKVSYEFTYVNTSTDSISIVSVRASCGCTTSGWSRKPIAPLDTGKITAQYNPLNRPGPFRKSLLVKFDNDYTQYLYIKGVVDPKPKTIADEYSVKVGSLRFPARKISFGRVSTKEPVTKAFEIYNESDSIINFFEFNELPENLSLAVIPTEIGPEEIATLNVTYDVSASRDLGWQTFRITLNTNDHLNPSIEFEITASVIEYFPPVSGDQMNIIPRLFIDNPTLDFGRLNSSDTVNKQVEIRNVGKNPLLIRKIEPNCDCLEIKTQNEELKSGETMKVEVTFFGQNRRGRQYKTITIFSNDPLAPAQVISVKADVN